MASNSDDKGDMSVSEAGQKGGQRTSETHDHEFYSEIGQKGGQAGGQKVKTLMEEGKAAEAEDK